MKRIVCLCVILLCSISFAFAQSRNGRTTKRVKKIVSRATIAENAWKVFFPKFRQAVTNRDYEAIKTMTVRDVDCNCEDLNNDGDLRDECLADWKKSAENNKSEVEWKDFKKTLSGIVCKLFKERSYDGYEFMRVVIESNSYGCEVDGPLKAGFGFIKGSWYLAGFGSYEVE